MTNEWYAKDTSNKIKAIFKSRMKDGMRCSSSIPYGYKRKPDDKQTLIVDEPAAEVVRKIFRLVCQGNSTTAIAEMLTAEKVLIPSAYAALNQPKNCRHKNVADSYRWSASTVGYILDRQEAREASPEYISQLEEKERIKREKMLETERKRVERAKKKNKLTRAELKEKAKTDPEAAKQLEAMRAKEAEARQRKKEREEARMAADPEYAAMMEARKKEYIRTRTA